MLEGMWDAQKKFYEKIRAEKAEMSDQQFCHSLVLHLHKEVSELLDAVGGQWKTHVNEETSIRKSQILMETVDITKLAWEAAIVAGVTPDEFFDAFMMKSTIVEWRRSNERLLNILKLTIDSAQKKTIVFDFDGVLVYYPEGFLNYVAATLSREEIPHTMSLRHSAPPKQYVTVDQLRSPDDLWTQLNISLEKYQQLKRDFIEAGGLRALEPIKEAFGLIKWMKERGYIVVIVTSRDKSSLEKMELDSYLWLQDHKVDHLIDGIYFTQDKARFIKEHFESVELVIEDNAIEVSRLQEAGLPSVCLMRPYNKSIGVDFDGIYDIIERRHQVPRKV